MVTGQVRPVASWWSSASQPDAVRAHYHQLILAIFVLEVAAKRLREPGAQFEDIADLNTPFRLQRRAAIRAGFASSRGRDIRNIRSGVVSSEIDVFQVGIHLIGACPQ